MLGKANFELALDIMGVGAGYTAGYITHTLQTNIRYEDDEFNLFKERQTKGMKGAFQEREKRFKGSPLAK
ncbi:MAG: enoyl-CoA hydratase/isomerase family protein [Dehalococcoidia bacterium]|nr:enoyl-CoA hydratase/isomerase family protein [Dehalococcoidia bacterium]